MVDVRPIRDEADYNAALGTIEALIDARPGTADGDHLEVLVTLVQAYEAAHHAIEAPDPIALLEFVLEQRGLDRAALHSQLASGLRLVVHLCRDPAGGRRRVAEVCVLVRGQDGLVRAERAWGWDGRAVRGSAAPAWGRLLELLGPGRMHGGVTAVLG